MDEFSTSDRTARVRARVGTGDAERLRKRYDGSRAAAAYRLELDVITLFRYEKGRSVPTGGRLRRYDEYLIGLAEREAQTEFAGEQDGATQPAGSIPPTTPGVAREQAREGAP